MHGVQIPYSASTNYGEGYAYIALPPFFRDAINKVVSGFYHNVDIDGGFPFLPQKDVWWKTAKFPKGRNHFCFCTKRKYVPLSLKMLLGQKKKGLVGDASVAFYLHSRNMNENAADKHKDKVTVKVEIERFVVQRPHVGTLIPVRNSNQLILETVNDDDIEDPNVIAEA